jgi:hypothetical protein
MRLLALTLTLAAAALQAQVGAPSKPVKTAQVGPPPRPAAAKTVAAAATPKTAAPQVNITRQMLKTLETAFDTKLATFNQSEPVYMLGSTRGIYLQGYGAVFSAELDLIQSPTLNPFHTKILAEEVVSTHTRKLKQLPLVRQAMLDQLAACARNFDVLPPNQQIVFVLRLDYQPWEDRVELPDQIFLHAERKSAAVGTILEEQ